MTKLSFSIKSLFFTIIIGLSLLLGTNAWAFASFLSLPNNQITSAVSSDVISSEAVSGFTNSDFETGSGSSRPQTPSNWSIVEDENNPKTPEASGLISLNTTEFQQNRTDYKLDGYTNPPTQNSANHVLMINGNDTELYYGYQSDSTVTLNANSYYQIRLKVYTDSKTNGAIASVYLNGEDFNDLETAKITRINTNRTWQDVVFYVATSTTKNSTVNLQLYLGQKAHTNDKVAVTSNGFALFDDVNITRLSGAEFARLTTTQNLNQNTTVVSLDETQIIESGAGFVENGNFENGLNGWTDLDNTANGNIQYVSNLNQSVTINDEEVIFNTHQAYDSRGQSGVVISANNGYAGIKSADIEIKQHQIYRITFWAKGVLDSGSLNIELSGILPDTLEETKQSATITALSTSTSALNGSWSLYEFYIVGHPLSDCTINLTLGLGSESSSATGYVAFSDIKSYLVTTQQMSDGQALNSEAQTLEMYPTSTYTFNNFSFNFVEIDSLEENLTYPLKPQNWTASNENNTSSGVVKLSKGSTTSLDNVLRLSTANDYQGYTSESVSLSANAYAQITVEAYAPTLSTGNAYIIIQNTDGVILAQHKISASNNGWTTYSIYLHNYNASQDLTATLSLGNENETSTGRIFFDNCIIQTDLTEDDFNAVNASSNIIKTDLNTNLLDVTISTNNTTPLFWDLNVASNEDNAVVSSGIINANDWESYPFLNGNPETPEGEDLSSNILVINSSSPVYAYYASKLSYTFTANSYYKLSVYVKTTDLTQDDPSEYTDDGQQLLHGASIILSNIDNSFVAINTNSNKDDTSLDAENEWIEYIMYIYTTSDTTSTIQLGLGSTNMPTAGYAYFSNLTITSLTEDEYNNETLDYDTEDPTNLPSNVLLATNVPEDDEDNTTPTTFGHIDPFAISTIIIAIAILVAVVGVFFKRFYKARPKKVAVVNSSDYDRLQTLLKDVDRRERKTAVNHKIKLLEEELIQSQKFLAEEQDELKKQIDSYNTAKEIAKDSPNVKLEAPNVKQIEKEIQTQTLKIEQIQIDLQLLKEERDRINSQAKREIEKAEEQAKINKEKLAKLNSDDKNKLNKSENKKRK